MAISKEEQIKRLIRLNEKEKNKIKELHKYIKELNKQYARDREAADTYRNVFEANVQLSNKIIQLENEMQINSTIIFKAKQYIKLHEYLLFKDERLKETFKRIINGESDDE